MFIGILRLTNLIIVHPFCLSLLRFVGIKFVSSEGSGLESRMGSQKNFQNRLLSAEIRQPVLQDIKLEDALYSMFCAKASKKNPGHQ